MNSKSLTSLNDDSALAKVSLLSWTVSFFFSLQEVNNTLAQKIMQKHPCPLFFQTI